MIFENIKFCKEFGNSSNYIKFHKKKNCISFFKYNFIDFIDNTIPRKKTPGFFNFWKIDRERLQ